MYGRAHATSVNGREGELTDIPDRGEEHPPAVREEVGAGDEEDEDRQE